MSFQPLHDRVLVRRVEEQERTTGGIVIPDTAKEKPQRGVVLAAGTGRRLDNGTLVPLDVRAGDQILFGKFAGTDVVVGGEDLLVVKENEILGVLDSAAEELKAA
jgi:chaperonin GroES